MPEGYLVTVNVDGSITTQDAGPVEGRLELTQAAVGGYIEVVGAFDTLAATPAVLNALTPEARAWFDGGRHQPCIAFCDEDGKSKGRPYNETGSQLWAHALATNGTLEMQEGGVVWMTDLLVGPICLLIGAKAIASEHE